MGILKLLLGPITGIVEKWQDGRQAKAEAKATMDRILTEAAASNEQIAGQIALARVESEKDSWKDEVALLTIVLPYWVAMITALFGIDAGYVQAMFENMGAIPEYWQETFQWSIWGALSIIGGKKILKG